MEREPTTEELINKITLLEKTLTFYSNEKNYPDMINTDNGNQARFALEQIDKISNYENDMILKLKEAIEEGEDVVGDEIDKLNRINDRINKIK
jgi:hypothetical protein